jgi:hypothetical protein
MGGKPAEQFLKKVLKGTGYSIKMCLASLENLCQILSYEVVILKHLPVFTCAHKRSVLLLNAVLQITVPVKIYLCQSSEAKDIRN